MEHVTLTMALTRGRIAPDGSIFLRKCLRSMTHISSSAMSPSFIGAMTFAPPREEDMMLSAR